MIWSDVLRQIDSAREAVSDEKVKQELTDLRFKFRSTHGRVLQMVVPEEDAYAKEILEITALYIPQPVDEPLLACAPTERPPDKPGTLRVPAGSHDGATLVIKPRETPLVVRPPVLEEVDEDSVAK